MAIITVNNPEMSSADWIAHHTKMQQFTSHFVKNEVFATVNNRQAIISGEMDEADQAKLDAHVARPESVAFDTRAQVTVEAFNCSSMD
jgi:hypothetical protein